MQQAFRHICFGTSIAGFHGFGVHHAVHEGLQVRQGRLRHQGVLQQSGALVVDDETSLPVDAFASGNASWASNGSASDTASPWNGSEVWDTESLPSHEEVPSDNESWGSDGLALNNASGSSDGLAASMTAMTSDGMTSSPSQLLTGDSASSIAFSSSNASSPSEIQPSEQPSAVATQPPAQPEHIGMQPVAQAEQVAIPQRESDPANVPEVQAQLQVEASQQQQQQQQPQQPDRPFLGKVLIVDPRGPSRQQGEGVRVMGMMLDLQGDECGMEVDVLTNTNNYTSIREGWGEAVQQSFLKKVNFVTVLNYNRGLINLSSYDRIIIGGKADLMRPGGAGVVSTVISDLAALSGGDLLETSLRHRTSAFWDDVPFERCVVDDSCDTVAPTVAQMAGAASTFYVLTAEDASRMSEHMRAHGITPLAMRVWPMRIANMAKVLPGAHFTPDPPGTISSKKRYALMMGNHHPVNTKNLAELFESGALNDICNEIERRGSPVKLLLTGAMTAVAEKLMERNEGNKNCVEIRDGFVSNEELAADILPQTRAIMNPFFFDVKSGISVKSFEAIMEGFPLLTSFYGLHGLNDIPECVFPQPEQPSSASSFKEFLITTIVADDGISGYRNFANYFSEAASRCVRGQNKKYPVEQVCKM